MTSKPRYPLMEGDVDHQLIDDTVYSWVTQGPHERNVRTYILNYYAQELVYNDKNQYVKTIVNNLHKYPTWRTLYVLSEKLKDLRKLNMIRGIGPAAQQIIADQIINRLLRASNSNPWMEGQN